MNLLNFHVVMIAANPDGSPKGVAGTGVIVRCNPDRALVQFYFNGKKTNCRLMTHQQLEEFNLFESQAERDSFLEGLFAAVKAEQTAEVPLN